jgi:hypothetical protein
VGLLPQTPDEKVTRYFLYYKCRNEDYSEAQIASKFKVPSAPMLYRELNQQGFPVCEGCGGYCGRNRLCEDCATKRNPQRGGGQGTQLPPASSAAHLFDPVIDTLDLTDLGTLNQVYRDERFEVAEVFDMSATVDLDEGTTTFGRTVLPLGVTQTPAPLLTKLISLYVIAGEPLDRLLEVLHPRYSAPLTREEKDKINEKAEKLVLLAGHVAKLVCGGRVRRGHHTEELSPFLQAAADYRNRRLREGVPEHEIEQILSKRLKPGEINLIKNFPTIILPD